MSDMVFGSPAPAVAGFYWWKSSEDAKPTVAHRLAGDRDCGFWGDRVVFPEPATQRPIKGQPPDTCNLAWLYRDGTWTIVRKSSSAIWVFSPDKVWHVPLEEPPAPPAELPFPEWKRGTYCGEPCIAFSHNSNLFVVLDNNSIEVTSYRVTKKEDKDLVLD